MTYAGRAAGHKMLMMAGAGLLDGCCSIDDIRVAEVLMMSGREAAAE